MMVWRVRIGITWPHDPQSPHRHHCARQRQLPPTQTQFREQRKPGNRTFGIRPRMKGVSTMLRTGIVLSALMFLAMTLSILLKPTMQLSEISAMPNLQEIIPKRFDGWEAEESSVSGIVNPVIEENLWGIYSQLIARTYRHSSGYQVMLSIAYGGDQTRSLQVHRPEVCYAASGFHINQMTKTNLETSIGSLPVMRLVASQDRRREPLTYWIRIGKKLVRGNIEQGFARLTYGLQGYVADGLLFRVSSIDASNENAFQMQSLFIRDLVLAVPQDSRWSLIGSHP